MSRTGKKLFNDGLRDKAWGIFKREINGLKPGQDMVALLKHFLTQEEINVLEKRLVAIHCLTSGQSLRDTSKASDLSKKTVISLKHGFRRPIPLPDRSWASPAAKHHKDQPRRSRRLHDYSYEAWLNGYGPDRSKKRRRP